jgi:hypothetical protein
MSHDYFARQNKHPKVRHQSYLYSPHEPRDDVASDTQCVAGSDTLPKNFEIASIKNKAAFTMRPFLFYSLNVARNLQQFQIALYTHLGLVEHRLPYEPAQAVSQRLRICLLPIFQ